MSDAIIWVIDDQRANHELVARSLPDSGYQLVHYLAGRDALLELEVYLAEEGGQERLPDLVFMDYFIGDCDGGWLTAELRQRFADAKLQGPLIVGHSSVVAASRNILSKGGDIIMRKDPRQSRSQDILSHYPNAAALAPLSGRGRAPRPD